MPWSWVYTWMSAHRTASSKALPIVAHATCLLWSIFLLIRWILTIPKLVPQSVMMLRLLSITLYQVLWPQRPYRFAYCQIVSYPSCAILGTSTYGVYMHDSWEMSMYSGDEQSLWMHERCPLHISMTLRAHGERFAGCRMAQEGYDTIWQ